MLMISVRVFPIAQGGRFGIVRSSFKLRRTGLFGFALLAFGLAGCGITLAPPGFVHENRHAVCRGWLDWNSHRRFSLTLESYDRLPPDSARVKLFRWSHGSSVEKPREIVYGHPAIYSESVIAPEMPLVTNPNTPPAEDSARETPADDRPEIPPPAPPSEMQDLSLVFPEDSGEHAGENSTSAGGEEAPSIPAVSISFAKSLDESEEANPKHAAACAVPNDAMTPQE